MLRMEIALFLILVLVGYTYFSSERRNTALHQTFSLLLIVLQIHLLFDAATVYTVNHLDTVPVLLNDQLHRAFIGSMVLAVFLFYQYISILAEEETARPRRLDRAAKIFLLLALAGDLLLPVHYAQTPQGIHVVVCYLSVLYYLILCVVLLLGNWKELDGKKRSVIAFALTVQLGVTILQAINPTWLISGMGLTLMTMAFYLTLENPAILRSELTEQKMSMLYLKSQVNPHFLYNTLDSIRIRAQLSGDKEVAGLLMRLVDFFRLSVKTNKQLVSLDEELELLEAYMELMCSRYPQLRVEYDIDPDLSEVLVPNFILQPIVENSLLHGLKNKGYQGLVKVSALKVNETQFEIQVYDTGSGFAQGEKERVEAMLRNYAKTPAKLEGNSIGVLNVQKRIKLLCGRDCGLSYTENETGGLTAHLRLPAQEEEML